MSFQCVNTHPFLPAALLGQRLTIKICSSSSGSSFSFWSFRTGYLQGFKIFFSTKRDNLGRTNPFEFFMKYLFFHTEDRMRISVSSLSTSPAKFMENSPQWKAKLLIGLVNQSSAMPCADFLHCAKFYLQ